MTYVDLSTDPRYMDSYVGAMFLPHTDMSSSRPSRQSAVTQQNTENGNRTA